MHHELARICNEIGRDRSLVQSGGGNCSVKDKKIMLIKASGYDMSDISKEKGIADIKYSKIKKLIENIRDKFEKIELHELSYAEEEYNRLLSESVISGQKPSLETGFHAILGKAIVHTHPVIINGIMASKKSSEILKSIFGEEQVEKSEILEVGFKIPGIELSVEIQRLLRKKAKETSDVRSDVENRMDNNKREKFAIFMENHGLTCVSNSLEDAYGDTLDRVKSAEKYLKEMKIIVPKMSIQASNQQSNQQELEKEYRCHSESVKLLFKLGHERLLSGLSGFAFPDAIVYCPKGIAINLEDDYRPSVFSDGKIVVQKTAKQPGKIIEIINAWACILCIAGQIGKIRLIKQDYAQHIANMEAEKYRQAIQKIAATTDHN